MNGRSTAILTRLERGPSALDSHYMLGLAVGEIRPAEARKIAGKPRDKVERIERLLLERGTPLSLRDFSDTFRRKQTIVHQWLCDGVAQGRLVIIGSTSNPRYRLPDSYVSQESAREDKLRQYGALIAAHPEGITAGQVAVKSQTCLRTARRWLQRGVSEKRWRMMGYSDGRSAYLYGPL